MRPTQLAQLVEFTEAAAYADLLKAAPVEWNCTAEETSCGWVLSAPVVDLLLFNRVIGCGLLRPAQQADLNAEIDRFRSAGVHHFGVQLSPAAEPREEIPNWLEAAGLKARDRWTKVYQSARPTDVPDIGLRIDVVGPEHALRFAQVITTSFGMPAAMIPWVAATVGRPRWRHYLAWRDEVPLGAGALFVRGDVGWLGVAGTLPEARRRGIQGALMARRLADAFEMGCRWVVTETSEELPGRPNSSFRNMIRSGFAVAYHRPNFLTA